MDKPHNDYELLNPTKLTGLIRKLVETRRSEFFDQFKAQNREKYIPVQFSRTEDRRGGPPAFESLPISLEERGLYPEDLVYWRPPLPYLIVLSGEYGMGKTRFLCYLAQRILDLPVCQRRSGGEEPGQPIQEFSGEGPPTPYPVYPVCLADIRRGTGGTGFKSLSWTDLCDGDVEVGREIQWAVQSGEILLALDGLDELIHNLQEFKDFFGSLATLLHSCDNPPSRFRVLLTVRSEYLRSWCGVMQVSDLRLYIPVDTFPNLYLLELDGFPESGLQQYLRERSAPSAPESSIATQDPASDPSRNGNRQSHFELVNSACSNIGKRFEQLDVYRLLQRPLLARLFSDWIDLRLSDPGFQLKELEELLAVTGRVGILERFLDSAMRDRVVLGNRAIGKDSGKTVSEAPLWNKDELAKLALKLYRRHGGLHIEFSRKSIEECVNKAIVDDLGEAFEGIKMSDWVIHKCPFIIRATWTERKDQDQFQFSHRVFLEYFTALGVWIDGNPGWAMSQGQDAHPSGPLDESPCAPDHFTQFDNLVLNVDMRIFLRELAKFDNWIKMTRHAYVLEVGQENEWKLANNGVIPQGSMRDTLDKNRCYLLAAMTYPDKDHVGVKSELEAEISRLDELFKVTWPSNQTTAERIAGEIQTFLDSYQCRWRHPRYLVPCFEPIAVFLRTYRGLRNQPELKKKFGIVLHDHYSAARATVIDRLEGVKAGDADAFLDGLRLSGALLVERCLHIGLRLRFPWVPEEAQGVKDTLYRFMTRVSEREDGDSEGLADADSEGLVVLQRICQLCEVIGDKKAVGVWRD